MPYDKLSKELFHFLAKKKVTLSYLYAIICDLISLNANIYIFLKKQISGNFSSNDFVRSSVSCGFDDLNHT